MRKLLSSLGLSVVIPDRYGRPGPWLEYPSTWHQGVESCRIAGVVGATARWGWKDSDPVGDLRTLWRLVEKIPSLSVPVPAENARFVFHWDVLRLISPEEIESMRLEGLPAISPGQWENFPPPGVVICAVSGAWESMQTDSAMPSGSTYHLGILMI